jgi:SpoVK/Ycf46/Vps4 family AAA+-type ATPase
VNTLLCNLDGVEGSGEITVIASSTRPDLIDKALLRPGRLDLHVFCDLPNEEERKQFILQNVFLLKIN